MPIVQLPPTPPKKVTFAVRLEEERFAALKRYAAFVGTNNYSIIVSQSLDKLYEIDDDYREWLEVHPDFEPDKRPRRTGIAKQARKAVVSGAPASSIVVAAEAANVAEV
jgi:hypothetical protein